MVGGKNQVRAFTLMKLNNLKRIDHESGVLILEISRPSALNALNTEVLQELFGCLREAAEDPAVRVVMLTGDGEKAFVAGADITEMAAKGQREAVEFSKLGNEVTKALELMPKPTIAAVNGYALGGGCELALACDFIVAVESAVFGLPEVSLGLIPGFGGTIRLMKRVGVSRAKELIFSARRMKSDEALQIGLVSQVFSKDEFRARALEVAVQIGRNSVSAVSAAKRLLNEFSESTGLSFKMDAETRAFGGLFGTLDQREGLSAFIEKRKPQFQGLEN